MFVKSGRFDRKVAFPENELSLYETEIVSLLPVENQDNGKITVAIHWPVVADGAHDPVAADETKEIGRTEMITDDDDA